MKIDIGNVVDRLTDLQRQMGAKGVGTLEEVLKTKGVDVTPGEIEDAPGGTLIWNGWAILLYIGDQTGSPGGGWSPYKFHFAADCPKIKAMRTMGQGMRYKVTNRSDGLFAVTRQGTTETVRMAVCRYCLRCVNWDNYHKASYSGQQHIVDTFDIRAYFDTYQDRPEVLAPPPPPPRAPPPETPPPGPPPAPSQTLPPPPIVYPDWANAIPDAEFRRAIVHIDQHRSLSEADLLQMVGGARRVRRFIAVLADLTLPFKIRTTDHQGVRTFRRVP